MPQKLSFEKIYSDCKNEVEKHLTSMWIGETTNESQKKYTDELKKVISEIFAPHNAMPLVECTNRYESLPSGPVADTAEALVGNLWKKSLPDNVYYTPYVHQEKAWKALNEEVPGVGPKSIVVTTGTGSGKTECFMLPLINDLIKNSNGEEDNPDGVQAIFLYPLNALMDDQKKRLEKLLAGTNIHYAVYNSNLAERNDGSKEATEKIKLARGEDTNHPYPNHRFPHAVTTREEMRKNPPQILITNPTMLEYILLRKNDNRLINSGKLKWVVLDEAHSYSGAGGAELAMLLRRIMLAFGTQPSQVRFAASSATLGNKASNTQRIALMKSFIASVTGTTPVQIEVIEGKQTGLNATIAGKYKNEWKRLFDSAKKDEPFMKLDELITKPGSIENKLATVDDMCKNPPAGARIKMHYFFRVPNGGLFVRLTDKIDGAYKIYIENQLSHIKLQKAPLLELCRCRHCGEYVAVAHVKKSNNKYHYFAPEQTDENMFDIEIPEKKDVSNYVFNISRGDNILPSNENMALVVTGDELQNKPGIADNNDWVTVANISNRCPNCDIKLTSSRAEDPENEEDIVKLSKFRVSSDQVSRWMAPVLLNHLDEVNNRLHNGQQFISFADSRQGAARASLKQNQEIERLWIYTTVFHALNQRLLNSVKVKQEIDNLRKDLKQAGLEGDTDRVISLSGEISKLNEELNEYMTWPQIAEVLKKDPFSDLLLKHFVEKDTGTDEIDEDGKVKPETKNKYIHSIMVEYLGKRPLSAASPETMGLFTTHYPFLDKVKAQELPPAIVEFNKLLNDQKLHISSKDFSDLLHIFLDYTVRSNQSIYLELNDGSNLDIFSCIRFANKKPGRRTVVKPEVTKQSRSRITRLLAQLLVDDGLADNIPDAIDFYKKEILDVIDTFWVTLADTNQNDKSKLIKYSTRYVPGDGYVKDKEYVDKNGETIYPWRLNVADISFKVFDKAALANTANSVSNKATKRLRPVNVAFKGYSPYLMGKTKPMKINVDFEIWDTYPYDDKVSEDAIKNWAKNNRSLLWENGIWGESGVFASRLLNAYKSPDFFLQAEHTGQIDKIVSRQLQADFIDRKINILACSTTMEMGVDLGNLELVMLHNVPPMPMNYKQRAGRSGRNDMVKSLAVTLCGSDSIGLRTLSDPLMTIINRFVKAPNVDLQSPQVIQRHANAFLIRETGVFDIGQNGGSLTQRVLDYYTDFRLVKNFNYPQIKTPNNINVEDAPWDPVFTDAPSSPWDMFNNMISAPLPPEIQDKLKILLKKTFYDGKFKDVTDNAFIDNNECRERFLDLIKPWYDKYQNKANSRNQFGLFRWKMYEILEYNLISFWTKNRFTPNANMPVNIVTFDLTSAKEQRYGTSTSNPTYDLRCALSQYAPGKAIVRDGKVNIVRGVRSRNNNKDSNLTFDSLFHDEDYVSYNQNDIANPLPWNVNGKLELRIIRPSDFLPDVTENATRITDQNQYSRVNAQLINTTNWPVNSGETHLYELRTSKDTPGSDIIYYNDGLGYGYCYCSNCGKLVAERGIAKFDKKNNQTIIPKDLNNQPPKTVRNKPFHYKIGELDDRDKPVFCPGSYDNNAIYRNMVLADSLQTDFTEIRLKKFNNLDSEQFDMLVHTLAILFKNALTELLGIDKDSVDFTITPSDHIVIFDTNQGGAGYSNQLADPLVFKNVLHSALNTVEKAISNNSKDFLLDYYTLRFASKIDPLIAKEWLQNELNIAKELPDNVNMALSKGVTETMIPEVYNLMENKKSDNIQIFFNSDFKNWDYGTTQHGWRAFILPKIRDLSNVEICIIVNHNETLSSHAIGILKILHAQGFKISIVQNPFESFAVYPVAKVGERIIVSLSPEAITLNQYWGNGTLYSSNCSNEIEGTELDLDAKDIEMVIWFLKKNQYKAFEADELAQILSDNSKNIIPMFLYECKKLKEPLEIIYQDEHLKSPVGMIIALKVINYFVTKINKTFNLLFNLEEYSQYSSGTSIEANIINSDKRDEILNKYTKEWLSKIKLNHQFKGVKSNPRDSLEHWRVITFKCGDVTLSIFPDGGFGNGWKVNFQRGFKLEISNLSEETNLNISPKKDLKFDIMIEKELQDHHTS